MEHIIIIMAEIMSFRNSSDSYNVACWRLKYFIYAFFSCTLQILFHLHNPRTCSVRSHRCIHVWTESAVLHPGCRSWWIAQWTKWNLTTLLSFGEEQVKLHKYFPTSSKPMYSLFMRPRYESKNYSTY